MGEVNVGDKFLYGNHPCIVKEINTNMFIITYENLRWNAYFMIGVDRFSRNITNGRIAHPLNGIGEAQWIRKHRKLSKVKK